MRHLLPFLAPLLLLACAKQGGGVPALNALDASRRLPPVMDDFQRVPVTATFGGEGEGQVAAAFYQQRGGTSFASVITSSRPDPRVAGGFDGPGIGQVLQGSITASRASSARLGGTLVVRQTLTVAGNGRPLLRCAVSAFTIPEPPAGQPRGTDAWSSPGTRLRSDCVGLASDRFVLFGAISPDTGPELQAAIRLGSRLVALLNDPNAPVATEFRPATPGAPMPGLTGPAAAPGGGAPPPPATPPGTTRRGRGYSI